MKKEDRKFQEKCYEEIEKIIRTKELTVKIQKKPNKKDIIIGITPI